MKRLSLVVLALFAAAAAAVPAAAQTGSGGLAPERSDTRGLAVGLNFGGSAVGSDFGAAENGTRGGALGVTLAYGLSEAVAVFLRYEIGYQNGHVDVGARYTFGNTSAALRPYVEAAFTRVGTTLPDGTGGAGAGFTGGAGVEYFFSPNLALDVGVAHSRGEFAVGALEGDAFSSTRLIVGVKWRP